MNFGKHSSAHIPSIFWILELHSQWCAGCFVMNVSLHANETWLHLSWPKCHPNCSKCCELCLFLWKATGRFRCLSSATFLQRTYSQKGSGRCTNDNNTRLHSVSISTREKEMTLERGAHPWSRGSRSHGWDGFGEGHDPFVCVPSMSASDLSSQSAAMRTLASESGLQILFISKIVFLNFLFFSLDRGL